MEVAIGNSTPFQREVREWQRVDPNTGALLSGRLEADRWISGPLNAYGKVVDSQNVSTPNGIQHSQRKQLEVLQARTSSGSLQVVRAHTVQTSSSRYSSSSSSSSITNNNFSNRNNSSSNRSLQYYTNNNSTPNNLSNTASNLHNNNFKSFFQQELKQHQQQYHQKNYRNEKIEPQIKTEHTLLPTEISTKFCVGVNKTQLDSNERENIVNNSHSKLNRGKSVSNEDLNAERDEQNFDDDVEPVEWRRVSKIRRSLQYPKTTSPRSSFSRPPDLPENSVSVLKIKQELENGRRLNTAMRNNHVDLVALDNILNGVSANEHKSPDLNGKVSKKATFLTAESLKEIRGKLRRLSDESLYKEDMSQKDETSPPESFQGDTIRSNCIKIEEPVLKDDSQIVPSEISTKYTPSSNISRSKLKSLSSNSDWFIRRKSYGFEKMTPPPESSNRMLESTDSGIGRSGEISSAWSPTEPKSTIVALGDITYNKANNPSATCITLTNGSHDIKQNKFTSFRQTLNNSDEIKRHSIAVDEAKYVRDNLRRVFESKTTSIHLNGMYSDDSSQTNASDDKDGRKSKRVEFCKTEVHFAAESGRVNIVETDGKPPPTNNFRRRRRGTSNSNISSSYLEAINSGVPVTHFGDNEKKIITPTDPLPVTNNEVFTQKSEITNNATNLSATTSINSSTKLFSSTINSTTTIKKEQEEENYDETSIRGILKNKPIKPRPYHLGENIESSESLWGIRLRPVSNDFTNWRASNGLDDNKPAEINETSNKLNGEKDLNNHHTESINSGYSTKVNLSTPSNFSWNNKETTDQPVLSLQQSKILDESKDLFTDKTTKICIDMTSPTLSSSSSENTKRTNALKSTSLIMRTIRSASNFDEAMKNLHINEEKLDNNLNDKTRSSIISSNNLKTSSSALKLISQMNAITKSNSANNIFKDNTTKLSMLMNNNTNYGGRKYSSSLDGDCILSSNRDYDSELENIEKSQYRKSSINKIEDFKTSYFTTLNTSYNRTTDSSDADSSKKPIAAPRMKKIGPTNVLSQQLSQLRRLYEAADQDSDDSAKADEEVKHYLGNLVSMEEKTSELSGSWSRVKAKRSVQKQNTKEDNVKKTVLSKNEKNKSEYKYTSDKTDFVHSNVMSIALHSPTSTTQKSAPMPIAKPRIITPVKTTPSSSSTLQSPLQSPTKNSPHTITITPQRSNESTPKFSRKLNPNESDGARDSLKLSTGPRKLREHELSYFGVNLLKSGSSSLQTTPTNTLTRSSSASSSSTKITTNISTKERTSSQKWQLTNDKPDLLRHSPNDYTNNKSLVNNKHSTKSSESTKILSQQKNQENGKISGKKYDDEPIYENLRKPSNYNRKNDLERDQRLLNELSKTADEILTTVSGYTDDDSMDDGKKSTSQKQKCRLHTIEENQATQKKMQSKAVQVSRSFGDSLRRPRSTRVSSASSNESIPRSSSSPQKTSVPYTTRRLCTKRNHEHQNHTTEVRSPSVTSSNKSTTRKRISGSTRMQRTSSRDTLNSHASSSEDLPNAVEVQRRPRRIRTKEKTDSQTSSLNSRTEHHHRSSSTRTGSERSSSNKKTHSHVRSENVKQKSESSKGSITVEQQPKIRIKSGVVTTTSSSSSRRSSTRHPENIWK